MADKDTRWDANKEWAAWTFRDEVWAFVRAHVASMITIGIGGVLAAIFAKSHPILAGMLAGSAITVAATISIALVNGRKKPRRTGPVVQRMITRQQWEAMAAVLRKVPMEFRISVCISIPYNDPEVERYTQDFARLLSDTIGFGGQSNDEKISLAIGGIVVRVRNWNDRPPLAQYLSEALTAADIDHTVGPLELRWPIDDKRPCDLVIGSNPSA